MSSPINPRNRHRLCCSKKIPPFKRHCMYACMHTNLYVQTCHWFLVSLSLLIVCNWANPKTEGISIQGLWNMNGWKKDAGSRMTFLWVGSGHTARDYHSSMVTQKTLKYIEMRWCSSRTKRKPNSRLADSGTAGSSFRGLKNTGIHTKKWNVHGWGKALVKEPDGFKISYCNY